jgi:hypothetical protein
MNTPIAVTELVEWIMTNRKGNAFKGDTFDELIAGVQEDIANHNLLFVLDENDRLIGVTTFVADHEHFVLFVKNLLVTKYSALAILAQHFKEHFDGFGICANRNNEEIMYDTHRLINHLIYSKGAH